MSNARRLRHHTDLENARRALNQVFPRPDTAEPRFGKSMSARTIILPVARDVEVELRTAIADARMGSPVRVYITTLGSWDSASFDEHRHWIIEDFRDPHVYDELDTVGWHHLDESAIYDPEGRWGMLVAFESYAIIAGDPSFIARVRVTLPPGVSWDIEQLRVWEGPPGPGIDLSWIDRLEATLADDGG